MGGDEMILWLKMRIISQYGTQRAFARACNKSENWVSELVLGLRNPNEEEWALLKVKLNLDQEDELLSHA
jgi:hypothetical protein